MASFTVAISLTASTRAFSRAAGFKNLVVVRVEHVEVLSVPSAGGGMGGNIGLGGSRCL
jgi:hypothetical protein